MTTKDEREIMDLREEVHKALSVEKRLSRLEATQYVLVAMMIAIGVKVWIP